MSTDLRRLADERAPAGFAAAVLARAGVGDAFTTIDTPAGRLGVAWTARGIAAVAPAPDDAAFAAIYRERFGREVRRETAPAWVAQIVADPAAAVRFDLEGAGAFQRAVLLKAREIPRGQVRSYAWIAAEIGRPRAVRAVGTALARNPVPYLIPCHRVVRTDGAIGSYVFGTAAKRALLASEGVRTA